jgi:glycosyltransferase involved in cell wall biosynthesis
MTGGGASGDGAADGGGVAGGGVAGGGVASGGVASGATASGLRVVYVLGSAVGGTALHAGMLAAGCRAAGLAVTAIGPAGTRAAFAAGAADEAADVAGAATAGEIRYDLAEISDRPHPARDAAALARLRRLLRAARPDIVHAHGLRAGAFAALALLPGGSGRPALVVTVHNAPPRGRLAGAIYGALELICARRAASVLCASADLAERMRRRGARAAEFDVPAPVSAPPTDQAVALARADIGAAGRPVILAVGRLAEQKGLDTLLAAGLRWRDRRPAPCLVFAGTGPLAGELSQTAKRTNVDLKMLGQRSDIPALLAVADVVVVPSRWEARALVVQEALRAGRPVVASRVGGIPALTGPEAALLVPPGDAAALADAVLAVLDDRELAGRLSAAARQRAADLPAAADAVTVALALYGRLAAPRRPARVG